MQLSLFEDKAENNSFKEEDFVSLPQNFSAFNFLKRFFEQTDFTSAQFSSMILKGEEGSGKSHLLHIFAKKFEAEFLDYKKISTTNLSNYFSENHFYILENINNLKNEELLFHLLNSCMENHAFLILSLQNNPSFQLKDLTSRLKNIVIQEINNPDLEAIKHLLENYLSRKQIRISKPVSNFIANNISRHYRSIIDAVKLVEFYINERGKKLTLKEARILFKNHFKE